MVGEMVLVFLGWGWWFWWWRPFGVVLSYIGKGVVKF